MIISNINNEESEEDILLKNRFEQDGNIVDLKWIDYSEELDNCYDIIIRRDGWIEKEEEMNNYKMLNSKLINRLRNNKKVINLIGLDGLGKTYLKDFY